MLNETSWSAAVYSIQEELESIFDRGIKERSPPDFALSATSRQYRSPQQSCIDALHETVHLHEMRHRQTTSRSTLKATKQATTGDRRRNRVAATMPEAHWGLIHKRQVDEAKLVMSVIVMVCVDGHM